MGVNPILARDGYDSWTFHKGSSEIRIFVYENTYLFAVSPINLLPKKEVERVLDYILSEDFAPYKLGIEGRQIYMAYRIHLSDLTEESEDEIRTNLVNLPLRPMTWIICWWNSSDVSFRNIPSRKHNGFSRNYRIEEGVSD